MDENIDSQNKADKALKELMSRHYQPCTIKKPSWFEWIKSKILRYLLS
jgi:hypothetical protein